MIPVTDKKLCFILRFSFVERGRILIMVCLRMTEK